jgi:hypothetical protein
MTKEQLIQIAKVGFSDRAKQFINFENCEMLHFASGVYRLYDKKDVESFPLSPNKHHLAIYIGEEKFIQFTCGHKAFNHYAAIKEMERLGLV